MAAGRAPAAQRRGQAGDPAPGARRDDQPRPTPVPRPAGRGRSTAPGRRFVDRGKDLHHRRRGLLDLSCAQCHERNPGARLRADPSSQGHGNAPPICLMDGGIDALHARFGFRNRRVRPGPCARGADEYVDLELYVAWRGQGLPIETPGVRY